MRMWGDPRLERQGSPSRDGQSPSTTPKERDETDYEDDWLGGDTDEGATNDARMDDEREKLAFGREWR